MPTPDWQKQVSTLQEALRERSATAEAKYNSLASAGRASESDSTLLEDLPLEQIDTILTMFQNTEPRYITPGPSPAFGATGLTAEQVAQINASTQQEAAQYNMMQEKKAERVQKKIELQKERQHEIKMLEQEQKMREKLTEMGFQQDMIRAYMQGEMDLQALMAGQLAEQERQEAGFEHEETMQEDMQEFSAEQAKLDNAAALARAQASAAPAWARVNIAQRQLELELEQMEEGKPIRDFYTGSMKIAAIKPSKKEAKQRRLDFWNPIDLDAQANMTANTQSRLTSLAEAGATTEDTVDYINRGLWGAIPSTLNKEALAPKAQKAVDQYFSMLEMPAPAEVKPQKEELKNPVARKAASFIVEGVKAAQGLGNPDAWFAQAETRIKSLPEDSAERKIVEAQLAAAKRSTGSGGYGGRGGEEMPVFVMDPATGSYSPEIQQPLVNTWDE